MKITELEKQRVRLGKTSITCVDEAGKTKGVVRGLESLKCHNSHRTEWDILEAMNHAGIWNSGISDIKDHIFACKGKLYYLNDLRSLEMYEKYFKDKSGWEQEERHYAKRLEIAKKAEKTMTVINCYIVN